jgi:hypothetical protein
MTDLSDRIAKLPEGEYPATKAAFRHTSMDPKLHAYIPADALRVVAAELLDSLELYKDNLKTEVGISQALKDENEALRVERSKTRCLYCGATDGHVDGCQNPFRPAPREGE